MLPDDAITHFHNLCSADFADASSEFGSAQREFEQREAVLGRGIGPGFAARIAELYANELAKRTRIIIANLKRVHADFGGPLAPEIDSQLQTLGANTLSLQFQALEGEYMRRLGGFGLSAMHPSGLDEKHILHQASVRNAITRHLWTLRRVPINSGITRRQEPPIIFNGPVAAVQTGPGSIAVVEQWWWQGESADLVTALHQLRAAIGGTPDLEMAVKEELLADVCNAEAELKSDNPRQGKLLRWLGGVGTVVQTTASVQPALETVRAAARAFGLPL